MAEYTSGGVVAGERFACQCTARGIYAVNQSKNTYPKAPTVTVPGHGLNIMPLGFEHGVNLKQVYACSGGTIDSSDTSTAVDVNDPGFRVQAKVQRDLRRLRKFTSMSKDLGVSSENLGSSMFRQNMVAGSVLMGCGVALKSASYLLEDPKVQRGFERSFHKKARFQQSIRDKLSRKKASVKEWIGGYRESTPLVEPETEAETETDGYGSGSASPAEPPSIDQLALCADSETSLWDPLHDLEFQRARANAQPRVRPTWLMDVQGEKPYMLPRVPQLSSSANQTGRI